MTMPLPPTDPPAPDNKLPGEAELAALYRQLPRSEPAPALDAAVLRAAAQALEGSAGQPRIERRQAPRRSSDWAHPEPRSAIAARVIPSIDAGARTRRRRIPHWLIGLGSAASLVLVAGLAWHMRDLPKPGLEPAATAHNSDAMMISTPPPSSLPADTANQADRSELASSPQPQAPPPLPSKHQANHLPPAALQGLEAIAPGQSAAKGAPFTLSDKPVRERDAATMNATKRAVLERRAASAPKQPAAAAESREVAAAAPVLEIAPPAPPAPAASMQREDSSTAADPGDTPVLELAKIQRLVQQHRDAEARQRLQAFQQAHPQWSLPADLRGLLGEP